MFNRIMGINFLVSFEFDYGTVDNFFEISKLGDWVLQHISEALCIA